MKRSPDHPKKKPTKTRARPVHYVLSTHWDREWYQPFQVYRQRLVHLLDRTIDDIEAGKLKGPFTTDGQSIVLDDYLEVRPERRAQVERLAREGRLKIGPWFVMPDEWLVSGEAIIRNLQLGRRIAQAYGGKPSDAGFVCDTFGHIGQLPQILSGFGIKAGFLWRGLEPRPHAHFWWEGSDGTRLLCYRFGRTGYCDFSYDVRRCHQQDVRFESERARRDLLAHLAKEAQRTALPPVLVFDGADHMEYEEEYYRMLFAAKPGADFPYEVRHSTLDAYLAELLPFADSVKDVVKGELRERGVLPLVEDQQWLIPGVLSSRVWIKQQNARCQALLCHWAEPVGAMASLLAGAQSPAGSLEVAWRWLLMNHPHDSICGCSVDEVHEDMKYRFAQCRQIAECTVTDGLRKLAAAVEGEPGAKEIRVLVANPLTRDYDATTELTLQLPAEWQCFQEHFGFEPKPGFRLYAADGKEVPYQRLAQDMNRAKVRIWPAKFAQSYKTNDITVALPLRIPALGYTVLTVREGEMAPKDDISWPHQWPTRHPAAPGFATSERSLDNGIIAVTVESSGSVTLADRRNGEVYRRLLTFEDIADIGDGWYHGQAVNDQAFVSTACASDVALVADGPQLARLRVRTVMRVPVEFRFDRMVRSEQLTELVIDSHLTLRKGSDRLEVSTTVQNTVRDHRLRVLLPTGARTDVCLADGAFDVVERKIGLPTDNHVGREMAVETHPHQTWSAVADRRRGLAVVTTGLLEAAARDLPERPLALTLFRATRRTVFTDGQPQGQLAGELTFNYWIVPVQGPIDPVGLGEDGVLLGAGLRDVQMTAIDCRLHRQASGLPPQASFLRVQGKVLVTSVREVGDRLEVRLYNPGNRSELSVLDFRGRPRSASRPDSVQPVDFTGRAIGRAQAVRDGRHRTRVRPKEIVTLRFDRGSTGA
ncbi:MAG: glycoside hydrolase family 38 [Opitutae bacterium]|nr:glycoside hydrolase family 38 [Opitutae bacterium]